MSTASSAKPTQTLMGIFEQPKIYHRRDFLRENKLNLRQMQRLTNKKLNAQQQQAQQKLEKQHVQHQNHQNFYVSRRSASLHRPEAAQQQQQQQQNKPPTRQRQPRSVSQQRFRNSNCNCGAVQSQNKMQRISSNISSRNGLYDNVVPIKSVSKKNSCHKQIQTEDIQDEGFLYDALKKCTNSQEGDRELTEIFNRNDAKKEYVKNKQKNISNNGVCHSLDEAEEVTKEYIEPITNNHESNLENISVNSARSCLSHVSKVSQIRAKDSQEQLADNIGNLTLETNEGIVMPAELTSRSRQSVQSIRSNDGISLTKKRSNANLHQLGNRDDVRLPRYLEREKREKEENRLREIERDPNCPIGHFVLTENERLNAMAMAENKYKALIAELNRMPMTTETLRIRTRKAEIEKELVTIEADMRIFSKSKVYVKQPDHIDELYQQH